MSRRDRRTCVIIIAVEMGLGYRPGHPWSGIVSAAVVIVGAVLLAMIGKTVTRLDENRRRR